MNLILVDRTRLAAETVRLRLAGPTGGELPVFKPGAPLDLSFAGFPRRYSLTSSPRERGHYEICVLRGNPSRGGSAYLHDQLRVGDKLTAAGPFNAFPLDLNARHSVFIAGGIGITPFFSMMDALQATSRSFELHYTARSADHFLPVPEAVARRSFYPSVDGRQTLAVPMLLDSLAKDSDLYVCGPRSLIEAVREGARERGWPRERVHFESFGPALHPADVPVTVHLALTGGSVQVPAGTTILDALLEHGVWAPYECRRGECGACVTEVLDGEPDPRDFCLTPAQRRTTLCTCVSRARTPELVLNL